MQDHMCQVTSCKEYVRHISGKMLISITNISLALLFRLLALHHTEPRIKPWCNEASACQYWQNIQANVTRFTKSMTVAKAERHYVQLVPTDKVCPQVHV